MLLFKAVNLYLFYRIRRSLGGTQNICFISMAYLERNTNHRIRLNLQK
jgi:hypothetical protein